MNSVHVTQEDIDNGHRQRSDICPVALAVSRAFFGRPVHVSVRTITAAGEVFQVPDEVRMFIIAYDNGSKMSPFTFELSPMS